MLDEYHWLNPFVWNSNDQLESDITWQRILVFIQDYCFILSISKQIYVQSQPTVSRNFRSKSLLSSETSNKNAFRRKEKVLLRG